MVYWLCGGNNIKDMMCAACMGGYAHRKRGKIEKDLFFQPAGFELRQSLSHELLLKNSRSMEANLCIQ